LTVAVPVMELKIGSPTHCNDARSRNRPRPCNPTDLTG
jgi:hypothetical protein